MIFFSLGEHDIFGEAVSDSEDEEGNINIMEVEEESRPSAEDSRLSDSASLHVCIYLFVYFYFILLRLLKRTID